MKSFPLCSSFPRFVYLFVCFCFFHFQALQSGLFSLDMMESVLARISEIIDSRKQLATWWLSSRTRLPRICRRTTFYKESVNTTLLKLKIGTRLSKNDSAVHSLTQIVSQTSTSWICSTILVFEVTWRCNSFNKRHAAFTAVSQHFSRLCRFVRCPLVVLITLYL